MTALCIIGTYEKLILGYELIQESDEKWAFKLVFTNNSHLAPVRCLAVSAARGILASAGSDEAIRLLDLKRRVEIGTLPYHSGSVNALHFYKSSHLFSCSDDGKLVVWRRRDWRMMKAFKRHKGQPVKGVDVHPTGCLALSIGNDRTLRTWDLVAAAQSVLWSPNGTYFTVVFEHWIDVYLAETGRICATFPKKANESAIVSPSKKITSAMFISDDVILFGMESGLLCSVNVGPVGNKLVTSEIQAHNFRIKGVALISLPSVDTALILTASSDGEVKLWRHKLPPTHSGDDSYECLASQRTDFRILSLAVWQPQEPSAVAKKSKEKVISVSENKVTEKPKKLKKKSKNVK